MSTSMHLGKGLVAARAGNLSGEYSTTRLLVLLVRYLQGSPKKMGKSATSTLRNIPRISGQSASQLDPNLKNSR